MRIQYGKTTFDRLLILSFLIFIVEIFLLTQVKQKVDVNAKDTGQSIVRGEYNEYNKLPRALTSANVSFLYALRGGAVDSSVITTHYQGKIAKIYGEPTSYYYSKYYRGFKLTTEKGEGYIFFTSKSFDSAQFLNQIGQAIRFDDLQIGQNVSVTETIDMLEKEIDKSRAYTIQIL